VPDPPEGAIPDAEYHLPGMVVREHRLRVPLVVGASGGEHLELFARTVTADRPGAEDLPWLLWLQGGPGYPARHPLATPWLPAALARYRVVLMDQRGTGRSTPLDCSDLLDRGEGRQQAAYLRRFRADAIVSDAEAFRRVLVGPDGRWDVLGESFGGFCVLTYLSQAPEGVRAAMIAGGLPPLAGGPEDVYRATSAHVLAENERFYERYPADRARAIVVATQLASGGWWLPTGEVFTVRRFRSLGILFGKAARFDLLHDLLAGAVADHHGTFGLTDRFLAECGALLTHAARPLYPLLHEASYCASGSTTSEWAAHRVLADFPEFTAGPGHDPFLFTGEMTYPWLFDEDPSLIPLCHAADALAAIDDWAPLYDPAVLADNTVPVAAAVYRHDMCVDAALSLETAGRVGSLRTWVSEEHRHDGLDVDPVVFETLVRMTDEALGGAA